MVAMGYNHHVTIASLLAAAALAASAGVPEARVEPPALQIGKAALVVVTDQDPDTAPTGELLGRRLAFFPSSQKGVWLAFVGVDLSSATGPCELVLDLKGEDGTPRRWKQTLNVVFKDYGERRLRVDDRFVRPDPAFEAEADKQERERAVIHAKVTPEKLWTGKFQSPVPGAVASRFGQRSYYNGVQKSPHAGADLPGVLGRTQVQAAQRGRVVLARPENYPGNLVILDHGWGVYSSYQHLHKIAVAVGDMVEAGQSVGTVGKTGRVTGPHLHWGMKVNEARVDPFSVVGLPLDRY